MIAETCPQAAYTNFFNTLNSLIDIFFPESNKKFNSNIHKIELWMTVGILTSRRKKATLYKLQLKSPTVSNYSKYKTFRNLYNTVIRAAKKLTFTRKLKTTQKIFVKLGKFYLTPFVNPTVKKKTVLPLTLMVSILMILH